MEQRMGERQRWAWLAGGLSVAIGACGCGLGWIWVLMGGIGVGLYYLNIERVLPRAGLAKMLPKTLAVLTAAWLVLTMAWSANLADSAFPMVNGFPILGWTMLTLAAWGSWKGPAVCARCAGVLCLFLLILYSMVTVFALPDVELPYLVPYGTWKSGLWAVGLWLLPAAVWYLPCKGKQGPWRFPAVLIVGTTALAAVTAGVLSPLLAASLSSPLYTLAQSVSLFGVVERIEPMLSATMTMGVFCLLSAMACAVARLTEQKWGGPIACGVAAVLMGAVGKLPLGVISAGCIVVFGAVPGALIWLRKKDRKKAKKGVDNGA